MMEGKLIILSTYLRQSKNQYLCNVISRLREKGLGKVFHNPKMFGKGKEVQNEIDR